MSAGIASRPWGSAAGEPVSLYTLENGRGMSVAISDYGGVVQAINVPDRDGVVANVVLGFAELGGYLANNSTSPGPSGSTHFGAIVGRYANRIAGGRFTLDGREYALPQNNGPNTLHGGPGSWNTKVWRAAAGETEEGPALALTFTDAAGANGFPGNVSAEVVYTLLEDGSLRIGYTASTDAPTVINLTNHSYFNLAGEGAGSVLGHEVQIDADGYTPVDANMIPRGDVAPVAGTPFDFRAAKPIGRDLGAADEQILLGRGYDHNWVLNRSGAEPALAARVFEPGSGRLLTVSTTEPAVQFYTANYLVGDLVGPSGRTYRQSAAFALETQHFPDSPNQPSFPSTVLRPGETFRSTTAFRLSVAG